MIQKITTGPFGTNTYLLSSGRKCILVDPGLEFEQAAIQIKSQFEVEAILITHGHLDHLDGIRYFDVPVYYPALDEACLCDTRLSLYGLYQVHMPFDKKDIQLILVEDGMEFELLNYHFKVIHTPGHTKGSVCYLCQEGLFSGDTLFHLSVGRTDFPTGDAVSLKKSLKKLIQQLPPSTILYPGHQKQTTIATELHNNPFLQE